MGERLIHRTSRRFALTEAGRVLAVRAARILAEGEAAEAEAQASSAVPRGRVRLAAPMSFGLRHVAPALPEFLAAYPEVSIDLQLDDRMVDLIAGGIDVAVRIADLADSSLIARRLCPVRRWVVGAPGLFRPARQPAPAARSARPCVSGLLCISRPARPGASPMPAGREESVTVKGPLSATNAEALGFALEAGLRRRAAAGLPGLGGGPRGRLVTVLDDWSAPNLALHLITPAGGPRPPRVAVLLDFLARRFTAGAAPWTAA